MRILQVLPSVGSETGGPVRSTLANCRAVHACDPDMRTDLVSTREGLDPEWESAIDGCLPAGMTLQLFDGTGSGSTAFSALLLRHVDRVARSYDLIVVRAVFHPISTAAMWIARQGRVPYVVVPHGMLSSYTFSHRRGRLKAAYYRLAIRRGLEGAAAIRFTTLTEAGDAARLGPWPRGEVIPHPVECESSPYAGQGGGSDNPRILFMGRIDEKKGLPLLVRSFAAIHRERESARLTIAGSGDPRLESELRALVAELGIEEAVDFPGFVEGEEKAALLASASAFVLASRQENFAIAVVEAASYGVPVVVSEEVGIAEEVRTAGAGIVVKRTEKELVSALRRLLDDASLREELGRNAYRMAREVFSPEAIGPRVLEMYRAAAATRREPRPATEGSQATSDLTSAGATRA